LKPRPERGVGQGTFSTPLAGGFRSVLGSTPLFIRGAGMARHSKEAAAILASASPLPLSPNQWNEVTRALDLSDREADVAELVLRDLCNKQIAAVLGISKKTVDEYLSYRIPKKSGTNGRMQLSMRVLEVALRGAGN
jgi:DNA-binding NarL/FixJ family response regulator